MPYATTSENVQLYFEEAGEGTPILFIHEFAADYASWEPQMRYFSRSHRCITYSARGYIPSHIPEADAYSYKHFRDDAIAMLDHLKIPAVGLGEVAAEAHPHAGRRHHLSLAQLSEKPQNVTYLENRHDTGKLPNKLYVAVVAAIGTGHVPSSIILANKVVPPDIHT